jgi:hypothetical protein
MAHHFVTVLATLRDVIGQRVTTGTTHLLVSVSCELVYASDSDPVFYNRIKLRCISNTEQLLCWH